MPLEIYDFYQNRETLQNFARMHKLSASKQLRLAQVVEQNLKQILVQEASITLDGSDSLQTKSEANK